MIRLKESFSRNGLQYTLLKRNDYVVLYGLSGTFTDKIINYEVCKIYHRKDFKSDIIRETLPTNEQFGIDLSRSFNDKDEAYEYYEWLFNRLKLLQGVPKAVTGVEENVAVVSEYQAA